MIRSKIIASLFVALALGYVVPARAQALPADCDPAVFTAMTTQAQTGFNNASLMLTSFMKPPVPTLSSLCQQMVNNVWNPQRFITEATLALASPAFTYSVLPVPGFSLSFNGWNAALQTVLAPMMQRLSLNFICTDAFNGIGNALRNVQFDPATGAVNLGASLTASGPPNPFGGFLAGAQVTFSAANNGGVSSNGVPIFNSNQIAP